MSYTEKSEPYKEGKPEGEEMSITSDDTERRKAAGSDTGKSVRSTGETEAKHSAHEAKEREKFIKLIRSGVRRSLLKFSIVLVMFLILIGAGVVWLLYEMPKWESEKYYDPIGSGRQAQFEKDMMYYSSLFMPDKKWNELKLTERGRGNYTFTVNQFLPDEFAFGDDMETGDAYRVVSVSGDIRKGALSTSDSGVFSRRASYPFRPGAADVKNESKLKFYDKTLDMTYYSKEIEKAAEEIKDYEVYDCYITFDKPYSFEEGLDMIYKESAGYTRKYKADSLWLAVCRKNGNVYEASTAMGMFVYDETVEHYDSPVMNNLYEEITKVNTKSYEENKEQYDSDRQECMKEVRDYLPKAIRYLADSSNKDFMMLFGATELVPYKRVGSGYLENGSPANGIAYSYEYDAQTRYAHEAAYLNDFADSLEKDGIYTYGCRFGAATGKFLRELLKDPSFVSYVSLERIG